MEWNRENRKGERERKAKGSGTRRSMERVPRRRGRRFPDNRSHLCQVVEPEGFPSRHGDEVTIRYFLLLGQQQQRGSAVVAIVGERRGMTRRKRGEKRVNEAIAEREEEGGRGSKPRGGGRERRAAKEREMEGEEGRRKEEEGRWRKRRA